MHDFDGGVVLFIESERCLEKFLEQFLVDIIVEDPCQFRPVNCISFDLTWPIRGGDFHDGVSPANRENEFEEFNDGLVTRDDEEVELYYKVLPFNQRIVNQI